MTPNAVTFDDSLLLLEPQGSRLSMYNGSARAIWSAVEAGASVDDIVDALSANVVNGAADVRTDVEALFTHWRAGGYLDTPREGGSPALSGHYAETIERALPVDKHWAAQWRCALGDSVVELSVENCHVATFLRPMFRDLETQRPANRRLEVRQYSRFAALFDDRQERVRTGSFGQIVGAVYHALLDGIHTHVRWLAMIHGAAVSFQQRAVIFPGPSGSGKSTLAAYLSSLKGFRYVADDLVALRAPDAAVVPWPLPLRIKANGLQSLRNNSGGFRAVHGEMADGTALYFPPRSSWLEAPSPLHVIIFPRYVAAASATITALRPSAALQRLLTDRIWLGHPIEQGMLHLFLRRLEHTPAYALEYGELDAAEPIVRRLLEDSPPPRHASICSISSQ